MNVVIGSDRLWCPETVNGLVGVCAELAIAWGHTHAFVWRVPDGALLARWPRHGELRGARAIARVGDEVIVDVGAARFAVTIATGAVRAVGAAPPPVSSARRIERTAGRGDVAVVDSATGAARWRDGAGDAVLSADGRWLLVGDLTRSRLRLVDLDGADGAGHELTPDEPMLASDVIAAVDGVVVADAIGGAAAWDLGSRARIATLTGAGVGLAARAGAIVASCPDGVARWDPRTGARRAFAPLPGKVQSGGFDRAGRRFAGVLYRLPGGLMYLALPGLWIADLDAGTVETIAIDVDHTRSCAIAPAGDRVAIADGEALRLYQAGPGWPSRVLGPGVDQAGLLFAPDGGQLWVGPGDEGEARVVDVETGGARASAVAGEALAWLDAGLLAAQHDAVRLHDPGSGAVRASWHFGARVTAASVDDGLLAVATADGRLHVQPFAW